MPEKSACAASQSLRCHGSLSACIGDTNLFGTAWRVGKASAADCTIKAVGWRICNRGKDAKRKAKASQCTLPNSVIQQSDLLLRYSTVTNFLEEDASRDPGIFLNLPVCLSRTPR